MSGSDGAGVAALHWLTRRIAPGRPATPARRAVTDYGWIAVFAVGVVLLKAGMGEEQSNQYLLNLWLLYTLAALGFYLVFGLAGRFAFSQTFMMALGAYLSTWLSLERPVWQAVLISVVLATLVALGLGLMLVRANEFYFGIATLAIAGIGTIVFKSWESFAGPSGVRYLIQPVELGDFVANTQDAVFKVLLPIAVIALVLVSLIERSPMRRESIASRDQPMVARTLGIPVAWNQVLMFVIGSVFASVAGSLYAHWQGVITPTTFGIDLSIGIFLMAILGGLGSKWGVVMGAAFYVFIPQAMQSLEAYQNLIYGAVLVVIIILLPEGLVGIGGRVRAFVAARLRARQAGAAEPGRTPKAVRDA